jgi:hypothetical protein
MSRRLRKANHAARVARGRLEKLLRRDRRGLAEVVTMRRKLAAIVGSRFWRWVLGIGGDT